LVILRTIYYLSKMSYILYQENLAVWTPRVIDEFSNLLRTVAAYFNREMTDILNGPKSHDLQFHLLEDVVRHGNPSGFDCSPGESKMLVQKLKNRFSNKSAPGVDVAVKIMRTELTRHIFDGGKLDDAGTDSAAPNVITEGESCKAFRTLLGKEVEPVPTGTVSLQDWQRVNNKNVATKIHPAPQHIALGVPDVLMRTCRKITTAAGSLYRDGGFYVENADGSTQLCILKQVYKDSHGYSYAVSEMMQRSAQKEDNFLREMRVKVFEITGRLVVFEALNTLISVPLLHACFAETPVLCTLGRSQHIVREERQDVVQTGNNFDCVARRGRFFLVNPLAFSVKMGCPFSGVL